MKLGNQEEGKPKALKKCKKKLKLGQKV